MTKGHIGISGYLIHKHDQEESEFDIHWWELKLKKTIKMGDYSGGGVGGT